MFLFFIVTFENAKKRRRPIFSRAGWIRNSTSTGYSAKLVKLVIQLAPEDASAKCKLYKKVFKLSNMAADALKSHADSERHKQEIKNLQAIRSFFNKPSMKSSSATSAKSNSTEETSQPSSSGSSSASGSTVASSIGDKSTTSSSAYKILSQSTIDTNMIFSSIIKAEIILSLFSVSEGFSNNSAKLSESNFSVHVFGMPYCSKISAWA